MPNPPSRSPSSAPSRCRRRHQLQALAVISYKPSLQAVDDLPLGYPSPFGPSNRWSPPPPLSSQIMMETMEDSDDDEDSDGDGDGDGDDDDESSEEEEDEDTPKKEISFEQKWSPVDYKE